jgi:hypothetical protein
MFSKFFQNKKSRTTFNRLVINTNAKLADGKLYSDNDNVKFVVNGDDLLVTISDSISDTISTLSKKDGTVVAVKVNGTEIDMYSKRVTIVIDDGEITVNGDKVERLINNQQTFDLQGSGYIFDRVVVNGNTKFTISDSSYFADHLVDIWGNDNSYIEFIPSSLPLSVQRTGHTYKKLVIFTYNNCVVVGNGTQVYTLDIRTHSSSKVTGFEAKSKAILDTCDGGTISIIGNKHSTTQEQGQNITIV